VAELPNSDPNGLVQPLDRFNRPDDCIEEVKRIIEKLADPTEQGEFTDGSIRHELRRLEAIRKGLHNFMTWEQRRNHCKGVFQCLKEACQHLNTAASAYAKNKQRNHSFFKRIGEGQEQLEQMVDAWNDVRKIFQVGEE